ncbi:MAG: aminotransferase class V-fold PLP-dependent enzyme [Methylacidiphilales bacterium]|nr:aminotransferase class V-fold PLP-dependent enzyme [Candidatus Methylacidiphilales bacterium]
MRSYKNSKSAYLNNAGQSLLLKQIKVKIQTWLDQTFKNKINNNNILEIINGSKIEFTKLLLGEYNYEIAKNNITLINNTSTGLSAIAFGLEYKKRDNILLSKYEFPSNRYVWEEVSKRHGCEIVYVDTSIEEIDWTEAYLKKINKHTKIIAVSSVQYLQGSQVNLQKLSKACVENNCLLIVDAIQQIGAFSLCINKPENIDAVVAGSHKWLNGISGLGIMYCSDKLLHRLNSTLVGWRSVKEINFEKHPSPAISKKIRKLENGNPNLFGTVALYESLKMINKIGIKNISKKILHNCNRIDKIMCLFSDRIKLLAPETMRTPKLSGILTYTLKNKNGSPKKPQDLYEYLLNNNIITSIRAGGIRLSPHWYTDESEILHFEKIIINYLQKIEKTKP